MNTYRLATNAMLALLIWMSNADAYQIQKWVDKDGKVHYGDKAAAPQNSQSVQIRVKEGNELRIFKPPQEAPKKKPADEKSESSDPATASCIDSAKKILALKMTPSGDDQGDSKKIGGSPVSIRRTCPNMEVECDTDTTSYKSERCEMRKSSDDVVFRGRLNKTNYLMRLAR